MGEEKTPEAAALIVGILYAEPPHFEMARDALTLEFGAIALESEEWDFVWTDYYHPEMGASLKRRFLLFEDLTDPGRLADIKRTANRLETERFSRDGHRFVNLDPGLLTLAKLILATTKDAAHRVYLRDGIHAEITLSFRKGEWTPNSWTYPDYRDERYRRWFQEARTRLKKRLYDFHRGMTEEDPNPGAQTT